MGRPYASELEDLATTYSWAAAADIAKLRDAVEGSSALPLLSVGSGGSLSAANLHAFLHREYAGQPAAGVSPFLAIASPETLAQQAVWFLSAGGGNPDVIGALRATAMAEPRALTLACLKTKSRAARVANLYEYARVVEFEPAVRKDGFLATNSLLALSVLLSRAYSECAGANVHFPPSLHDIVDPLPTDAACRALVQRETLVVLCSAATLPAGIDLESKFTEAALGHVQATDFRNFAHGRHHWLAKRARESAVLAISTAADRGIAERTLALLPDVPVMHLSVQDGPLGAVGAMVSVLDLVGRVGVARGIDPGRPGVPDFGRKIYHLRSGYVRLTNIPPAMAAARRKQRAMGNPPGETLPDSGWTRAYSSFIARLSAAEYGGFVFDYDGTLCGTDERFDGIRPEIAAHLRRLLSAGAVLGIATGRGKSVREDLRRKLPTDLWPAVVVGYYNGGDIATLQDGDRPTADGPCHLPSELCAALQTNAALARSARITVRPLQLTIEAAGSGSSEGLYPLVASIVQAHAGISLVRSSHSLDVLAPGVSKRGVTDRVRQVLAADDRRAREILCIGDRGAWPGNDFALLAEEPSLSVDEVSTSRETCWNIAPAGHRGVQATLTYLTAITGASGRFRFESPSNSPGESKR
ncbi:MAG: sucrose-6-phosphate hydrolase [Acidobacteria bacterium]|nr:sucrose-6-phosphate hydrolase [Acidobacteriota bacterium]